LTSLTDKITVTRAKLNTPPFIEKSITVSLVITNRSNTPLHGFSLTDFTDTYGLSDGYCFAEGSAVLFCEGKKHTLKARADESKITLEGINVPPRESVFVFYRFNLTTLTHRLNHNIL